MEETGMLNIKYPYKGTFCAWILGVDLKKDMSNAQFYRHRKEILKHGIDISKKPPLRVEVKKVRKDSIEDAFTMLEI